VPFGAHRVPDCVTLAIFICFVLEICDKGRSTGVRGDVQTRELSSFRVTASRPELLHHAVERRGTVLRPSDVLFALGRMIVDVGIGLSETRIISQAPALAEDRLRAAALASV
jgi:hypothetical protein